MHTQRKVHTGAVFWTFEATLPRAPRGIFFVFKQARRKWLGAPRKNYYPLALLSQSQLDFVPCSCNPCTEGGLRGKQPPNLLEQMRASQRVMDFLHAQKLLQARMDVAQHLDMRFITKAQTDTIPAVTPS